MNGHKIFVSYKYADNHVANLSIFDNSTVRDYVNEFERRLDKSDHIYKGESEGEDLSYLSEEQIWSKIKDLIFDSTLTIVFISKGMRDLYVPEREQWIPWEVYFSLRTQTRKRMDGSTYKSNPNAMLGVVLPDEGGSYSYYYEAKSCCQETCTLNRTDLLFDILSRNMFNKINAEARICSTGRKSWLSEHSYIKTVKWSDFINKINGEVEESYDRQARINEFDIHVKL